ncbi:MAG: ABC-F family ATP-binding cassette domain-containing protein [Sphingobacterium sp.]
MINLHKISYIHPNKDVLFTNINFNVDPSDKIALVGDNGSGKSTLLRLIAQKITPTAGQVVANSLVYHIPQLYGQYDHFTVVQTLGIANKIHALHQILGGALTEEYFEALDNDWQIENRCIETFQKWALPEECMHRKMDQLSGGEKAKVLLSGIHLHNADVILMDEPSNHLDGETRQLLYQFVETTKQALVIASHDRKLLNFMNKTYELNRGQLKLYGGNYDFFRLQKENDLVAQSAQIQSKEKDLRKARQQERKTAERMERSDVRGKQKQTNSGLSRIMMNTLRNNAENSTSKVKDIHRHKISGITDELTTLRSAQSLSSRIKLDIENSALHHGKILYHAEGLNIKIGGKELWKKNIDLHIESGERISLEGANGSGKTTLINLLLGKAIPSKGKLTTAPVTPVYFDQNYSLLEENKSIYEMAQSFNDGGLEEHEVKTRLSRFLFPNDTWNNPCSTLSGGQRMKLILCGLTVRENAPDVLFMDEPTNNVDIQSMEILTNSLIDYKGTLIVVSHDKTFLEQLNISRKIQLN